MSFTVVDLPEPFGPSKPKTSPRRTLKSTLSTARALGRPQKSLKTLVSPVTEMTTSPLEGAVRDAEPGLSVGISFIAILGFAGLCRPAKDGSQASLGQFLL